MLIQSFLSISLLNLLVNNSLSSIITFNSGCKLFREDKKTCLHCSDKFYKDQNGVCQPVSPLCLIYDYQKYKCISCSNGYYVKNKVCMPIDPQCKFFNQSSYLCMQCYKGYTLFQNNCTISINKINEQGCNLFNNSICIKCSSSYYYNNENKNCVKINPLCKTFNESNGHCLSCYHGYKIIQNICQVDNMTQHNVHQNLYCKTFQNSICIKCSFGYYLNKKENKCQMMDPLCKTFDYNLMRCLRCYQGFIIRQNLCRIEQLQNCKQFSQDEVCMKCTEGYYLIDNYCQKIDPFCKIFDHINFKCVQCFLELKIKNNQCLEQQQQDKNCLQYKDNKCIKCIQNTFFKYNQNSLKQTCQFLPKIIKI